MSSAWPPSGPTSARKVIPAYPYVEYQNDDNISAFFDAYNIYAQAYVDWFNGLNLPVYTQAPVSGALLDRVAASIYGIIRPGLPTSVGSPQEGPVNSFTVNSLPVNGFAAGQSPTYTSTNDDFFRRIITWAFFKGDGKTFTPRWLKRRINRFLTGVNGTNVANDTTYGVSVFPTGFKQWTISLINGPEAQIFAQGVKVGALELPFQITWTITLVDADYVTTETGDVLTTESGIGLQT